MKKIILGSTLLLVLSACTQPYDETNSAIPSNAANSNPYYYGEQNNAENPYATSNVENPYGFATNNPLATANGVSYNDIYGTVNPNMPATTAFNNVAASNSDFYSNPSYGVNVSGGPQATAKDRIIYFSYDSSSIDSRAQAIINEHARYLRNNPQTVVILEGHTDERGTREYNIALGERRAYSVKQHLQRLGVNGRQLRVLSYGEERPAAYGSYEQDYARNRRVVILY